MYDSCGNEARDALIGYIEPITTGVPLSAGADAELDAPDVAGADVLGPLLELLLEQADAATASAAAQAKPAAKRGHFLGAIKISPPYAGRGTLSLSGHS
jgi:hypothetical protein